MVLSDRFAGKAPKSLFKRTLLYVCGFGFGALLIVGVLSFTLVSIAEGLLPKTSSHAAGARKAKSGSGPRIIGGKTTPAKPAGARPKAKTPRKAAPRPKAQSL